MDPQDVLKEFGIDVHGPDPAGQYQWKMLSLKASSPERQRLEKAWSAFVLDRKEVEFTTPPSSTAPAHQSHPASASAIRGKNTSTAPEAPAPAPKASAMNWIKKRWLLIALPAIGIAVLWLWLHDLNDHKSEGSTATTSQGTANANEWRMKYEAIKTMLDTSAHDDEHHEEFVLLAETAKSAINAGQGAQMLEQINVDLSVERAGNGPKRISELASHTGQWKIVVHALVMNKAELLDHEKFQGHHEGEL